MHLLFQHLLLEYRQYKKRLRHPPQLGSTRNEPKKLSNQYNIIQFKRLLIMNF